MTDGEALFNAILENPDDDTPRLVYADWLEENGQSHRAELIRLQCQLAHLSVHAPGRAELETRERERLSAYEKAWAIADWPTASRGKMTFERGFVARLSLRETEFGDTELLALASAPQLRLLRTLDLSRTRMTQAGVRVLAESPCLESLTFLDLRENGLSSKSFTPMARWPRVLQLVELWGHAPVQGEGRVGAHPFYFRARWDQWTFGLSEDPNVDETDVSTTTDTQFAQEGKYGNTSYAASHMPLDEALALICRCGAAYRLARSLKE